MDEDGVVSLFAFEAQDQNTDLSFPVGFLFVREITSAHAPQAGVLIHVVRQLNEDWLEGEYEDRIGQFPTNFVSHVPTKFMSHA